MVEQRVAAEVQRRLDAERPPLKRSEIDAAAISRFIRSHLGGPKAGAEASKQLPK